MKPLHNPFGIVILILILIICAYAWNSTRQTNSVTVSDEATAIKIAEAAWLPIYGDSIYSEQPFVAEYDETEMCWYVHGTLPKDTLGGVAEIKIRKSDGKVIYISHGQ